MKPPRVDTPERRAIEERVEAAREEHVEEVRVIERVVIERRVVHERERDREEARVRARGRDALAAWLTEFGRTVGESPDGGTP